MRPIRDLFYLRANADLETEYVLSNGSKIYISPPLMGEANKLNWSEYERAVQVGEIAYCPMKISSQYISNIELKPKDIVLTHHFCIREDNFDMIEGEKMYRAIYHQLFAVVRNGEIIPLHDYLFCEPVFEPEENCRTKSGLWLKDKSDQVPLTAKILYACQSAAEHDLHPGDLIRFQHNHDYRVTVGKKDYWRIGIGSVQAKVLEL